MTKLNNFKKNWSQSDSGSEKWMGKHEFVRLHLPKVQYKKKKNKQNMLRFTNIDIMNFNSFFQLKFDFYVSILAIFTRHPFLFASGALQ